MSGLSLLTRTEVFKHSDKKKVSIKKWNQFNFYLWATWKFPSNTPAITQKVETLPKCTFFLRYSKFPLPPAIFSPCHTHTHTHKRIKVLLTFDSTKMLLCLRSLLARTSRDALRLKAPIVSFIQPIIDSKEGNVFFK